MKIEEMIANKKELKQQYLKLAKLYHPDSAEGDKKDN